VKKGFDQEEKTVARTLAFMLSKIKSN